MFPHKLPTTLTATETEETVDYYTSWNITLTNGTKRRIAQVTIYSNGSMLVVKSALYNPTENKAWRTLAKLLNLTPQETLNGYSLAI